MGPNVDPGLFLKRNDNSRNGARIAIKTPVKISIALGSLVEYGGRKEPPRCPVYMKVMASYSLVWQLLVGSGQ